MTTTSQSNVLITGTKAGIGYGLLSKYASCPNTTVIAAIRDAPDSATAISMISSITNLGTNSRIIPVQYDASSTTSAQSMLDILQTQHPDITHLDLVVANAARNTHEGPVSTVSPEDLESHLRVNTIAPVLLYQATRSLLLEAPATTTPRFILVSTVAASLERIKALGFQIVAYGMSKAAGNYFIVKADQEEDRLALVAVHPGWVQTEKGNEVAKKFGRKEAPMTLEDCCEKLVDIFDGVTKEDGGKFLNVEGGSLPW